MSSQREVITDDRPVQTDAGADQKAIQRERRAQSLAAMGLVTREGMRFRVKTAALRGHQESYEVWRDENRRPRCSCDEFERQAAENPAFRCEHILAVKYSLAGPADGREEGAPETPVNEQAVIHVEFANLLRMLRQPMDPKLIKTREGWTDRQGNTHWVEYIEWHTAADILDRIAPNWSHAVRNITQIGDTVAVTASITIEGVTREGVGTGSADNETGIKKAEHDALKRAAVKFGIARDLYQRESDVIEGEVTAPSFPRDPRAKTVVDLVTPKQLWMIRSLGREAGCDVDQECQALMQCNLEEISKRAASSFIDHLKRQQQDNHQDNRQEDLQRAS